MADRVSVSITIGGRLPASLLDELSLVIESERVGIDWEGTAFDPATLPVDEPLRLMAHEVAWGRFEDLEAFCVENGLAFARWSGGYPGQWGAERCVFTGSGEPTCYAADEDDDVVIGRSTAERLGSYAAIIAHFEVADFTIPPFVVVPDMQASRDS
ncbi:hypothetical protein [Novosphingobium mathurense]|uniref:Uncharacterized protein n=1 Tax=Novosphingobium mathurense TaxID=428990 RepID=A0A1U6H6A1_9SPHN|nr:hypothetical protein [Novosphingobium mathurense]SLJ91311.1 hypothetical protein SAMN06295987_1011359 [Novosphingobium mathurense]